MSSIVTYLNEAFTLAEDAMEEGYMAQTIDVKTPYLQQYTIQRSSLERTLTLLFSFPGYMFENEILYIDEFLSHLQIPINCYLIFHEPAKNDVTLQQHFKVLQPVYDMDDNFGTWYGTKITNGSLAGSLCKSLFLIGKDGSIFYIDIPSNMEEKLNLEKLRIALNKAYISYTGVGCHG